MKPIAMKRLNMKELLEGQPLEPGEVGILAGSVNKMRSGTTQYGDWESFVGHGRFIRSSDGQVFNGTEIFVPDRSMSEALANALHEHKSTIDFVLRVSRVANAKSKTGYSWVCSEIGSGNVVEHLDNLIQKALPAPAKS